MNERFYEGRRVLVLGGLGFIGLNVTLALKKLGARVRVLARSANGAVSAEPYASWLSGVEVVEADFADYTLLRELAPQHDVIFSTLGAVTIFDHRANFEEIDTNLKGHLNLLYALQEARRSARIVFVSSRQVYGVPEALPVGERHVIHPIGTYGIHKFTVEQYLRVFAEQFGIEFVNLRLANPYGPLQLRPRDDYNIINSFIAAAQEDREIRVFGDGDQVRDYVFVRDLAHLILECGTALEAKNQTFNVGCGRGVALLEAARRIVRIVGRGSVTQVPWPEEYRKVETGSYVSDISKLRMLVNWEPSTDFDRGVAETAAFLERPSEYLTTLGSPSLAQAGYFA